MVGPILSGEKVNLRPLSYKDMPRRVQWLNDVETVKLFAGSAPVRVYCLADAENWRTNLEADSFSLVWAIETSDGRHIGDVDLHGIDPQNGTGKLTILIGDKSYWGKGCGTDAVKTLLQYAFTNLGLEMVGLRVYDFNERAIRCYEKCGFSPVTSSSLWSDSQSGATQMIITKESFQAENPYAIAISA